MPTVADLAHIGAPVQDPVKTAAFIGGMVLTRRQKAAALKDYLREKGIALTNEIRRAADLYVSEL